MRAPQTRPRAALMCAGACACGRQCIDAEPCEVFPSALECVRLGPQAFQGASAFNANIGAWNTAAVTDLTYVCVPFGTAARHRRRP